MYILWKNITHFDVFTNRNLIFKNIFCWNSIDRERFCVNCTMQAEVLRFFGEPLSTIAIGILPLHFQSWLG
nr:MAG TPA: hypothetical protein [Caudoviricetes sp.]